MSEQAQVIRIWQQDDGLWRWRWLQSGGETSMLSFIAFDSRDDAEESAHSAFPGVPTEVVETKSGRKGRKRRKRRRRWGRRLLVIGVVAIAVARARRSSRH